MGTLKTAREKFERRYALKARGYDLEALAKHVEDLFGLKTGEIYSPGKYRRLIQPRSVFCYWAVRELGETATALAKKIGLSQSGVSKAVLRGEKIVNELDIELK